MDEGSCAVAPSEVKGTEGPRQRRRVHIYIEEPSARQGSSITESSALSKPRQIITPVVCSDGGLE